MKTNNLGHFSSLLSENSMRNYIKSLKEYLNGREETDKNIQEYESYLNDLFIKKVVNRGHK